MADDSRIGYLAGITGKRGRTMPLNRRVVLKTLAATALGGAAFFGARSLAEQVLEEIKDLKAGQFTWHPERSPDGPVAIIVSLTDQLVHVYRNGIRIAVSTCSTGKPGHETPTGIFTILQKDKHHRSSTYDDAPMPNMNRLTWSGGALHAGNLPGYPASHGCIRLPLDFSAKLFTITHIGTPVIVASGAHDPKDIVHPGLVLAADADTELTDAVQKLAQSSHPSDWPEGTTNAVTSVIVSGADKSIQILEDGAIIASGTATIQNPDQPLGSHVFVLSGADDDGKALHWMAVAYDHDSETVSTPSDLSVIKRVNGPKSVVEAMKARMHPGMVLVFTDLPAHPDTRTGGDFVVMDDNNA